MLRQKIRRQFVAAGDPSLASLSKRFPGYTLFIRDSGRRFNAQQNVQLWYWAMDPYRFSTQEFCARDQKDAWTEWF
jgi:hypothetical protein